MRLAIGDLARTGSRSHGLERRKLSRGQVVNEIISTIETTFGKEILTAMESCFDTAYKISFKDNSIFDHADKFAEGLLYAFGEGREPILRLINERLAKLIMIEDAEELTKSDAYGFVSLINMIKRKIE